MKSSALAPLTLKILSHRDQSSVLLLVTIIPPQINIILKYSCWSSPKGECCSINTKNSTIGSDLYRVKPAEQVLGKEYSRRVSRKFLPKFLVEMRCDQREGGSEKSSKLVWILFWDTSNRTLFPCFLICNRNVSSTGQKPHHLWPTLVSKKHWSVTSLDDLSVGYSGQTLWVRWSLWEKKTNTVAIDTCIWNTLCVSTICSVNYKKIRSIISIFPYLISQYTSTVWCFFS